MRILLAGATGYLGRHLLRELHDAGHHVRALARHPERLAGPGEAWAADVTRPRTLRGAADGMDAVITTIGVTGHGGDPWATDHRGNLALFDEAVRAGVGRFVFVHVLHGEAIAADLTRAKSAFAAVLRRAAPEHLVVNPSGYFSDATAYLPMARTGVAGVLGGGRARLSPIHGADLAAFIRAHVEAGTTGDVEVGGPEVITHRQVAELAFEVLGKRPRIVSVPGAVARAGLVPVRAVAPDAAGVMAFLLAAGEDGVDLDRVRERAGDLGPFIRSLVGLDRTSVVEAFADYLDESRFSVSQIRFVNQVVDELTANGNMEPGRLFESPYTDLGHVDQMFPDDYLAIVQTLRQTQAHALPRPDSVAGERVS